MTSILFLLCMLFGIIFPRLYDVGSVMGPIIAQAEQKPLPSLILFIILNNLRSSLLAFILGIVFFGIFSLLVNGYIIGSVITMTLEKYSIIELWRLFPHGIFELPAFIIAISLGLSIARAAFLDRTIRSVKERYKEGMLVYLVIVVPLIIIAGFIEGILFWSLRS